MHVPFPAPHGDPSQPAQRPEPSEHAPVGGAHASGWVHVPKEKRRCTKVSSFGASSSAANRGLSSAGSASPFHGLYTQHS